jgi:nicotinamidase/pyrazinamidase
MDTVFFDIDTQVDFLDPAGALYVPGSQAIAPNIRRLLECASEHGITTISPMCAHVVDDPEFRQFPPHCIEGSPGQRRYFDELPRLSRHLWLADATVGPADLHIDNRHHYVVQKRTFPMFANPWMQALRERGVFDAMPCVAFGVATDVCVLTDVLDLCGAGAQVRVVRDAIAGIDATDTQRALAQMENAGARFVTTSEVLAGR